MPILSQTLKGYNSETYFDQLYLGSTREVLGIDQSIAIDALSTPALFFRPKMSKIH
jgi:hypothetical protein